MAKAEKKIPDREKVLRDMAHKLGMATLEELRAVKRARTHHNDVICGARTPTASDRRTMAALERRVIVLSRKRIQAYEELESRMGIPSKLIPPGVNLGGDDV